MPLLYFIANSTAVTADPSATGIKPSRILFIKVPPIIGVGDFTPLLVFANLLRLFCYVMDSSEQIPPNFVVIFY